MRKFLQEDGVTLIELMVLLIILSIAILPIAAVQTRSNRDVFNSGMRTEALNVASFQMENARALGFTSAASDSGNVGGIYTWATTVTPVSFGLNSVTVTVAWKEQGDVRSLQLTNMLSTR